MDIRNELIKRNIYTTKYMFRKWKANPDLRQVIENSFLPNFKTFEEKVWYYINLADRPKCKVCNNNTELITVDKGFRDTCSRKCSAEFNKDKIRRTLIKKYGVDNVQKVPEIRLKTNLTNNKKFNQIMPRPAIDKLKQKYGDLPFANNSILEKAIKTLDEKYPKRIANLEIQRKSYLTKFNNRYNYKQYIMPSGQIHWVKGYDSVIIDYLLKSDVMEEDIITDRNIIPNFITSIFCAPDIFIKSRRMLLTVVGISKWRKESSVLLDKHSVYKSQNYASLIIIWDNIQGRIHHIVN